MFLHRSHVFIVSIIFIYIINILLLKLNLPSPRAEPRGLSPIPTIGGLDASMSATRERDPSPRRREQLPHGKRINHMKHMNHDMIGGFIHE